tara:strand:- start:186 stop:410 length:225 start_codon:yes stop_codon:yes gene_type:complete
MKRLLLPLLAGLALPTAVNAESYWLILRVRGNGKALEKIEMLSMEQCQEQGKVFKNWQSINEKNTNEYICLIGK